VKKKFETHRQEEAENSAGTPIGVQVLSFLCGLVVVFLGFKSIYQDYTSIKKLTHLDQFVETQGKFLQIKVRHDSTGSPDEFYPDVLYEYFVDGKSIWGWRLSYEEMPESRSFWENRLKKYAVGSTVSVFYNPALPKDAIVEKKYDSLYRTWMKMLLGFGFFLAGMVLAVLPTLNLIKSLIRK
jgi:Protein of unknown function (DUF3592)